jgi:hypothetical protein
MAALLACCSVHAGTAAPDAAVSHLSAAGLWRMLPPADGPVHVSLLTGNGRKRRAGIVIHRPPSLCPDELTQRSGIWVTRPARTLRDLRRTAPPALSQRALRKALDLRLVSDAENRDRSDLTRSELERMFLALCRRHRLPVPEVNARVTVRPRRPASRSSAGAGSARPVTYEVDFLWRDARLIVEADGFRHHGHREAFEADRARDAALHALGFRVLRFTYRQVRESPHEVAMTLRAVLEDRSVA